MTTKSIYSRMKFMSMDVNSKQLQVDDLTFARLNMRPMEMQNRCFQMIHLLPYNIQNIIWYSISVNYFKDFMQMKDFTAKRKTPTCISCHSNTVKSCRNSRCVFNDGNIYQDISVLMNKTYYMYNVVFRYPFVLVIHYESIDTRLTLLLK